MSIIPAQARPATRFVSQAGWMLWTGLSLKDVYNTYVKGEGPVSSRICSTRSHYPLLSLISCVIHTLEWTMLQRPELVVVANLVSAGLFTFGAMDTANYHNLDDGLKEATYFAHLSNISMVAYNALKIGAYKAGEAVPLPILGIPFVLSMTSTRLSIGFEKSYTSN